ncbi:MAG: hypothetical protein DWQ07_09975 [Chloroflexi bacterium]|nr:MAG: hypothetical protein DWQ07_09975 [Chloroflexota bacterium]MBL1192962.1 hypothetical protein [Chloroflexota bacterium]NOH10254.1 hypothetical protein [Chloroflexota bacterium]
MIATNDECYLPCWWGIQPGITQWNGLRDVLGPLGWLQSLDVINDGRYEIIETVNQDNFPNLGLSFYSLGQDTIQYVRIGAEMAYPPESQFYYEEFEKAWSRYSLAAILTEYGKPNKVSVYLQPGIIEQGGSWEYQIYLIYEDRGIFTRYTFENSISYDPSADEYRVCPHNEDLTSVGLYLKPPADSTSFSEVMEYIGRSYLGDTKLLEDISDLSVEEFHALFAGQSVDNCLVSDGSNWP